MTNYLYSNVKGITLTQIVFTILLFLVPFYTTFEWQWWLLSVFVYYLTGCLGITITFHRYITHRSFKMPKWCEYLFSFFGCMGGTGSTIGWLAVHRMHHRHSDDPLDPHSPHHLGWRIWASAYEYNFKPLASKSLLRDQFHIFLHKYYYAIFVLWGLFLFALDWKIGFFGFIAPAAIQIWASNLSNWGNHYIGYANFKTNDKSKNTWVISALTWGEGWHNNHHARPGSYTFQYKWWEFDISAYTILLICLLSGNLSSLRKVKPRTQHV